MRTSPAVRGYAADGFDPVRAAFASTLTGHPGEGAAFAAYVDGRLVVDLVAGRSAPNGEPWGGDTRALVFSCTKAVTALAALLLVERGTIALDDPVVRHWPSFAGGRRDRVLVGHVLAHTAGLPGIHARLTRADLADGRLMERLLESEEPWWMPGSRVSYHALTYGWLLDGVVRRAAGRSIAEVVHHELARPLGLGLCLGAGAQPRAGTAELSGVLPPIPCGEEAEGHRLVYLNPEVLSGAVDWWNGPVREAGLPAVGAVGSARDLARMFACVARGGEIDGTRLFEPGTIELARSERARGLDPLTGLELAFGAGVALQTSAREYGPPPDAFGHDGVGGSVQGAWPSERVGFSYVTGLMRASGSEAAAILAALWRCVHS
jgi:CubicO group peptidase (beta-lactamase class C family)